MYLHLWIWKHYYNFKLLNLMINFQSLLNKQIRKGTVLTATQTGERKEFNLKQLI